jgi:hypothetical protein
LDRPLDAAGDDFLANLVSQNLFAQVGHDRSIENGPINDDRTVAAQPALAGSGRQLSSGRAIRSAEEIIQAIPIHRLTGTNDAGQLRRIDGR